MYQRMRAALLRPKQLKEYRHDRWYMVLIFLLILAIIETIPNVIRLSRQEAMTYETRLAVRTAFRSGEELDFAIEDGTLVANGSKTSATIELSTLSVVVTTEDNYTPKYGTTAILLYSDHVSLAQSFITQTLFKYTDYEELANLDLSLAHDDDAVFWGKVFTVAEKIINEGKNSYIWLSAGIVSFEILMHMLVIILIFAFLQHLFTGAFATFGDIFRVTCYAYAPAAIVAALGDLYSLSWLSFVGLLITLIYQQIAVNSMIQE